MTHTRQILDDLGVWQPTSFLYHVHLKLNTERYHLNREKSASIGPLQQAPGKLLLPNVLFTTFYLRFSLVLLSVLCHGCMGNSIIPQYHQRNILPIPIDLFEINRYRCRPRRTSRTWSFFEQQQLPLLRTSPVFICIYSVMNWRLCVLRHRVVRDF